MKTAFVFLAPGFEEIEAISIIDTLRRGGINTLAISITSGKNVKGAHAIEVVADEIFDKTDFSTGNIVILPGGMPGTNNLNAHEGLKALINQYNNQQKYVAAICAAPLVLGQMGLLKGKPAISYPGFEDQLQGATIEKDKRVVVSGNIITSKGPGTAIEFALQLVEMLVDKATAEKLAEGMIVK